MYRFFASLRETGDEEQKGQECGRFVAQGRLHGQHIEAVQLITKK